MGLLMTRLHRPLAQHPPRCVAPARPHTLSERSLPHPKETCLQGPSPAGRQQANTTAGERPDHRFPEPQPHPAGVRAGVCGGARPGRRARDPLLLPFTQSLQGPLGGSRSLGCVPEAAQLSTAGPGPAAGLGVDFPAVSSPPRWTQQNPRKNWAAWTPAPCPLLCAPQQVTWPLWAPASSISSERKKAHPGRSQAGLRDSGSLVPAAQRMVNQSAVLTGQPRSQA